MNAFTRTFAIVSAVALLSGSLLYGAGTNPYRVAEIWYGVS